MPSAFARPKTLVSWPVDTLSTPVTGELPAAANALTMSETWT